MSDVPSEIEELLTDEELANLEARRGWARGSVTAFSEKRGGITTIEDAVIELLNGDGRGRPMSGVRFMGLIDGELKEGFAYPSHEHVPDDKGACYVVEEWDDPEDPDFEPATRHQAE